MPFADSKSSNKKIRPNEIATDEHEPLTVLMNNWSLWNNDQDRFHLTFKGGEKLIFQEFYRLYKTSFFSSSYLVVNQSVNNTLRQVKSGAPKKRAQSYLEKFMIKEKRADSKFMNQSQAFWN